MLAIVAFAMGNNHYVYAHGYSNVDAGSLSGRIGITSL